MKIDPSRYRLTMAVTERFRAGEDLESIADDYDFDGTGARYSFAAPGSKMAQNAWIVELLVAAEQSGYERAKQEYEVKLARIVAWLKTQGHRYLYAPAVARAVERGEHEEQEEPVPGDANPTVEDL